MECEVYLDFNGHSYLKYREADKVWYFVSMVEGTIETIQMTINQMREVRLRIYEKSTVENFARVYLSSYVAISNTARAILRPLAGYIQDHIGDSEPKKFSGGSVSLHEICEEKNWDPKVVRKHLRKIMDKPGGRWEWEPDEAVKIVEIISECLAPATTN